MKETKKIPCEIIGHSFVPNTSFYEITWPDEITPSNPSLSQLQQRGTCYFCGKKGTRIVEVVNIIWDNEPF